MNAPVVWIAFPAVLGLILLFLPWERWVTYIGTVAMLILAAIAFWIPTDTAQLIGPFSVRIDSTLSLFGRQMSLTPADQIVLILIFMIGAFWFFGTLAADGARRIVPLGMIVIALLVASLAVQPFLYAALFIEMAVLVTVPLLLKPRQTPGRGLIRFLVYQTLAMPFILFAGFLLSGITAGPADIDLIVQAAGLLGLGFAFLLAVFPLYTWIPLLAEEAHPYAFGFIMTLFPTFSLIFGLNFIDRYSWLRDSATLLQALRLTGLLMIVTGGVWAAFQRSLSRTLAYAIIAETGVSLLAVSLPDRQTGLQIMFFLLIPRALALGVWTLSLSIFQLDAPLRYETLQGLGRKYPLAAAGLVLSNLTLAGMPLLASFPARQALWEKLAATSFSSALWFALATFGLWFAAIRSLTVLVMSKEHAPWKSVELNEQRVLVGLGLLGLFLFGLFPQWAQPLFASLPAMFQHLGK